jgi:hypothetical protein
MAVSDLLPRKSMGSKSRRQTLHDRLDYDQKKEKTKDGELVSSYMCSPETVAEEFEMSKLLYEAATGRSQPKERDIIAYRIIQSFKPGEITPEEANKLGYELAMRFTKGKHQFLVATHVDKAHIHNHVEFNSTNLECNGKFNNFYNSALVLRRLNDQICREHGYSVIEKPKARGQRYQEKAASKRGRSYKEQLRQAIDRVLPDSRDFEDFLKRMRKEGYEIKHRGKSLEFLAPGQQRFTRSQRLGDDYTKEALQVRLSGSRTKSALAKQKRQVSGRDVNLLVDIQAKMQAGKGKGYERWAKVFNLKEAAKTLNFLVENGVTDYSELEMRAETAGETFDTLSLRIKQLEERMTEVAQLKTHIINYSKTRDIYKEYKKSRHKKEYRAEHADEIKKHEAAKAAFDALGGRPIPKVAQLSEEYATLLAEKKERYEEYKAARKDMIDYQTAKQNVDRILGLEAEENGQQKRQETER